MNSIRIHNKILVAKPLETGEITVIDSQIDGFLELNLLDSPTLPSDSLLSIKQSILDQLGMDWEGNPAFWDPMDRNLGGGVVIANIWQEVA